MKLILSRKGFDSQNGGCASPILSETNEMFSLPIPEVRSGYIPYSDIRAGNYALDQFIRDLAPKKTQEKPFAHLDPDLNPLSLPRPGGWKPLFGQSQAAEGHLQQQNVGKGDLFLYFGWFRQAERRGGRFRYVKDAPDIHALFGWLQIRERIASADAEHLIPWAKDHPHSRRDRSARHAAKDSLYVSADTLTFAQKVVGLPGAGVFSEYHPRLCLTRQHPHPEVKQRSLWMLPGWFHPAGKASGLSYHSDPRRWQTDGDAARLQTVGMGQEFVLDCAHYPEAVGWAADLIRRSVRQNRASG